MKSDATPPLLKGSAVVSAESTARVSLRAPLTGVMVPIEDVPDPVFARRMVGDGFSVDPLEGRLTPATP